MEQSPTISEPAVFSFALFAGRARPEGRQVYEAWGSLRERFLRHSIRPAKDGPGFVPAEFEPSAVYRCAPNVRALSLLVLDIDDGTPLAALPERLRALAWCAYTTHSHRAGHPKFRLVLPLARPVDAANWRPVWQGAARLLAPGHVDPACKDVARFFYFPSCPMEAREERWAIHNPGQFIDPAELAAAAPPPPAAPPKTKGAPATVGRGDYRTLDVVAWFRAHGLYGRDLGAGKHAVVCAWLDEHTVSTDPEDSDTVVWEAAAGRWPNFFCAHAHCEARGIKDLMDLWGDADAFCLADYPQSEPKPPPPGDEDAPPEPPVRETSAPANGAGPSRPMAAAPAPPVVKLAEVLAMFRRWLHLPDDWHIKVILGAYAANLLPGDPVWLMVISAPGSGKTEVIQSLGGLPHVKINSSLSGEGSLLSATPKREQGKAASGGLLREIGEFGVLVLKDFTSLLQMHQDSQAPLLAALREVYDGSWTRRVGVDGGKVIHWAGKLGVIAACTPAIDLHHAVMGAMGERFLFYRFPLTDAEGQAGRALRHVGHEEERREQLTAAVAGLIAGLPDPVPHAVLSEGDRERLVGLACLAVRCRSAVQRDRRTREIEFIPDPEAPGRLVGGLARLLAGLEAIGVERAEAWLILAKVSVDSMPALRWAVFQQAAARAPGDGLYTSEAALATRHPTVTARRALEDLHAHDLLTRAKSGERNADTWELTPWARQTYERLRELFVPVVVGEQAK